MFEKIVVGADDSETAAQAAETAMMLAAQSGAELHIVTAYKRSGGGHEPPVPAEFRYTLSTLPADQLLDRLAERARAHSLDPVVHASTDQPAQAIVKIAAEEGADLIVVGNKGMRGMRRVLGSVPNDVAHRAPCSVMIVDTTS
jgi:nucleotide-binding universal stress UspA family protein